MFEIEMNGTVYQFKFGMGFLREIEATSKRKTDAGEMEVGFGMLLAHLSQYDTYSLSDMLYIANKGFTPRVTKAIIDAYIDDECEDIDALFEQVMETLKSSNATKKKTVEILSEAQAERAAQ